MSSKPTRARNAKQAKPLTAAQAERRLAAWFTLRDQRVAPFQREAWRAWRDGASGLINAPTGAGKTLAAIGGPLIDALSRPPQQGLQLLCITPLRALASDTAENLQAPIRALGLPWRIVRKTGDSGSGERARLARGAAELLVTTPESLSLLLSYPDGIERLKGLRGIVVDEWHELIGSKRGVLLELALTRLRNLLPDARLWALSATIGNLPEAMRTLLGVTRPGTLITAKQDKRIEIATALPEEGERFPWAGHLGLTQLPRVMAAIESSRSSLVFTNTRSQAELWHEALASVWPHPPETLALHHGSLDNKIRRDTEERLRAGLVRCVVATSSLDLGVDFGSVERVMQIGSPKSVGRLLQRAGRSGHAPGETSRVLCVPTQLIELAEIAAVRRAHAAGVIEARRPLKRSLDVLAQHLITLALGGGFTRDAALAEVRDSHAYEHLTDEQFDGVLDFITRGGRALTAYPDYHKVVQQDAVYRVIEPRIARLHRLGIGTITADGSLDVRFQRGGRLGRIEEQFIARLAPGDRFLFAGRSLELIRVRDMTAWVRLARGQRGGVPRWMGTRMPLSGEISQLIQHALDDRAPREAELRAMQPMLAVQRHVSAVPTPRQVLVEIVSARDGQHLFVYPFAGRLGHEGLAAVFAWRLARWLPGDYGYATNDYGVIVSAKRLPELDAARVAALLDGSDLEHDLRQSLNLSELARRQFREVARVAGLVFTGFPGAVKTVRQVQASSGLLFDVLRQHDPEHLMLQQAERDVLDRELDFARLEAALADIATREIVVQRLDRVSPLGFPLWAEGFRGALGNEEWELRVRRLAAELERAAA